MINTHALAVSAIAVILVGCASEPTHSDVGKAASAVSDVTWINIVGADTTGGDLTKTAGPGWDAGAASAQSIAADGFLEFTTAENTAYKLAGLSHGDSNQSYDDIDFALYLTGFGGVSIYEDGVFAGEFGSYAAGDVFRVENSFGHVSYRQNGQLLYASAQTAVSPLLVDTSLYTPGATITNVVLKDISAFWQNPRSVAGSDTGLDITSAAPAGTQWAAGASSVASIPAFTDGYVEFSTAETSSYKIAGLSAEADATTSYNEIDWGFYLAGNGSIYAWENHGQGPLLGTYRAGDVFRVAVVAGVVSYYQNGSQLYSSPTPRDQNRAVHLDTSLFEAGSTVTGGFVSSYWQNVVGVLPSSASLLKTGDDGWNAGASTVTGCSGNCYAAFTTGESTTYKMAGLSHDDFDQGYGDIDFAFYLTADGVVLIYEAGQFVGDFGTYRANDLFVVQEIDGQVKYFQNEGLLYTSRASPIFPLLFDTSLYSAGATVENVVLAPAVWENQVGIQVNGESITKVKATSAWDAGASTAASFTGDGSVEFSTGEITTDKMAGLTHVDSKVDYSDIDYAFHMASGGSLFIYESGVLIGSFGLYSPSDSLNIVVDGGAVNYYRNTFLLYTSTRPSTGALRLDASLYSEGATIQHVTYGETAFWQTSINVEASGNNLRKNAGANNDWDAGASSLSTIGSSGYMEFTAVETNTDRMAGLSNGDNSASYTDIDFAIYVSSTGLVCIYESSISIGCFGHYSPNDRFRVEYEGGQVSYLQNGTPFYTSSTVPTLPLRVDTSLDTIGATLQDVVLVGSSTSAFWKNGVDVSIASDRVTLTKTSGGAAWNAGASSLQSLAADGYVEFSTAENFSTKMAGLSLGDGSTDFADIDYAFYLTGDGVMAIEEAGTYVSSFGLYSPGDVFRIEVSGDTVSYLHNGSLVYTSARAAHHPLLLDTSLYSMGATFVGATVVVQ